MTTPTQPRLRKSIAALAACVALSLAAATARADDQVHVRGTVASLDGASLVVHGRDGADVTVRLADNWTAIGVVKASIADIKPGTFIGTASVPQAGDTQRAIEVVVLPEKMRGSGEGHYPWDLKPTSMMTNATVGNIVDGVDGRTITLSYKGGEKTVTIPPDVPIVTLADAQTSDITTGAAVFVPAKRQPDGTLQASAVIVGKDGLVPPM